VSLSETLDPGHKVITHFHVSVVEDSWLVEVIGFDMQRILKVQWVQACTEGLEPVHGNRYSLTVGRSVGILVLLIFLLDNR
jgi:hypothetical protein